MEINGHKKILIPLIFENIVKHVKHHFPSFPSQLLETLHQDSHIQRAHLRCQGPVASPARKTASSASTYEVQGITMEPGRKRRKMSKDVEDQGAKAGWGEKQSKESEKTVAGMIWNSGEMMWY